MKHFRHQFLRLAFLASATALVPPLVLAGPTMEEVFANPPQAAKPHVMWMWMGSNLSKQGITRDLEAPHEAGFGGKER